MLEPLLSIGSRITRVFRVLGQLAFIRRLYDFLAHEGRRSRAETLEQTAKAVLDLEKAETLRIKNSRALLEMMRSAGFPEEKIQATLSNPQEMQRVSAALTTLLQYVDKGVVTLNVVQTTEQSDVSVYVANPGELQRRVGVSVKTIKKSKKRAKRY
jgi:hypothetical protein